MEMLDFLDHISHEHLNDITFGDCLYGELVHHPVDLINVGQSVAPILIDSEDSLLNGMLVVSISCIDDFLNPPPMFTLNGVTELLPEVVRVKYRS